MATRKETAQRKADLQRDLRAARREGALRMGEQAVSQRALAEKYGLSQFTISRELRQLAQEGVLHSVERVGTFAGARVGAGGEFYLLITRDGSSSSAPFVQTQSGFEAAISRRGDAVVTLERSAAEAACERGALPLFAGVFDLALWPGEAPWQLRGQNILARVSAAKKFEQRPGYDLVSFDDAEGGRLATEHLLARGHKRIAFLGLHSAQQESSIVDWSAQRESGWRQALELHGLETQGLAFRPAHDALGLAIPETDSPSADSLSRREVTTAINALLECPDVTAVVAANDCAALELLKRLDTSGAESRRRLAIVGFDNHPLAQGQLLSSLQLSYDELGRVAADLLWERHNGRLDEAPQQRMIGMRLISRLTCHPDWAQHAFQSRALQTVGSP